MNCVRRKGRDAPDEIVCQLGFWVSPEERDGSPRDFKRTVVAHVERDPAFAMALLDAAAVLSLAGQPDAIRLKLCELVNAPVGFPAPTV